MYDYNFRATDHVLHATDRLDTEQLNTTLLAELGSLRVIFAHAVGLEWLWRTRWQGGNPAALPSPDDFPTQAAIHMRWRAEQPLMRILGDTAPGRAWARVGIHQPERSGAARRTLAHRPFAKRFGYDRLFRRLKVRSCYNDAIMLAQVRSEMPMGAEAIGALIEREVLSWPHVTAHPHRFGGVEFQVNQHEIGHLHGDHLADLPFPIRVRRELVAAGRASPHHILPDTGWVSYYIHSAADAVAAHI